MCPETMVTGAGVVRMHHCFPERSWRKLVEAQDVKVKTQRCACVTHRHALMGWANSSCLWATAPATVPAAVPKLCTHSWRHPHALIAP